MAADRAPTATVRRASTLFSARAFRPVLKAQPSAGLDSTMQALRESLAVDPQSTNGEVVNQAYRLLSHSYRPEYVYKNLITSKVFVGRHRASNAVILNEFRVGTAIADSVLLNGRATVYEIKTELDNPDKLERQLAEYYKAFPQVFVVVHDSMADRYQTHLQHTSAGVIAVGARWRLSTVRPAGVHTDALSVRTMFNALRADETRFTLSALGFAVPEVPNGLRYQRYLDLAMQVPAPDFHEAFRAALKRRPLKSDTSLYLDPDLFPLRSLLIQLNPSPVEGDRLRAWLASKE